VSQSEEGFERVMQSVTLEIEWTLDNAAAVLAARLTIRSDPG
jgi:Domain of unknown function (DUF1926)